MTTYFIYDGYGNYYNAVTIDEWYANNVIYHWILSQKENFIGYAD